MDVVLSMIAPLTFFFLRELSSLIHPYQSVMPNPVRTVGEVSSNRHFALLL
jgi:pyrroline-5-carboxylate reductase